MKSKKLYLSLIIYSLLISVKDVHSNEVPTLPCPSGTEKVLDVCRADFSCPNGTQRKGFDCKAMPTCPNGSTVFEFNWRCSTGEQDCRILTNGLCKCPGGGTPGDYGKCYVEPISCPAGTSNTNGQCFATPICPAGLSKKDGYCIAPVSCPAGYNLTKGSGLFGASICTKPGSSSASAPLMMRPR